MRFDWDDENIGHIARHDVTPFEVEETFTDRRPYREQLGETVKGEERTVRYGSTAEQRPLTVVYTKKDAETIRTVTAHTMHRKDRKLYAEILKDA